MIGIGGNGLIVIVTVIVSVHPKDEIPFIMYVDVTIGVAITLLPVEVLSPVDGIQVYMLAPFAVKFTESPIQIAGEAGVHVTVGKGLTTTVILVVFVHPKATTPIIVYVVVTIGLAVTALPAEALSPVEGVQ